MAKKLTSDDVKFNLIIDGNEAQSSITKFSERARELKRDNENLKISMKQLEYQGKKNTDEYRALQKAYKDNSTEIKTNEDMVKSLEKQLGINLLTMRQLSNRLKELKGQQSNISKSLDPAGWARVGNEIKKVTARIDELKGAPGIFGKIKSSVLSIFSAFTLSNVLSKAWSGIKNFAANVINSTNDLGDRYKIFMDGAKAATEAFYRSIATGDFSNLLSNMREAISASNEYTKAMDEISDRMRAITVQEQQLRTENSKLKNELRDKTKSDTERLSIAEKIQENEKKILTLRTEELKKIRDEEVKKAASDAKLSQDRIKQFVTEYNTLESQIEVWNTINAVQKRFGSFVNVNINSVEDLRRVSQQQLDEMLEMQVHAEARGDVEKGVEIEGLKVARQRIDTLKEATQEQVNSANEWKKYGSVVDGVRDKIAKAEVDLLKQEEVYNSSLTRVTSMQSTLLKEQNDERIQSRLAALDKEHAQAKLALAKQRSDELITAEAYEQQLYDLEVAYLQKRINAEKEGSAERTKLEQQLVELDIKTLAQREQAAAQILIAREQHFAALGKISDDYNKRQLDKNAAEVVAIQQKYDAAFDANIAALEKNLITKEEYLQREAELEAMQRDEINAKVAEQREKAENERKDSDKKYAQERLDALKQYELLSNEQLKNLELEQLKELNSQILDEQGNLVRNKLLTDEEYQKAKAEIEEKYEEAAHERDLEAIERFRKNATEKLADMQAMISIAGDAVTAMQDAATAENDLKREQELGKLNEQYNSEVAAAAGNEEKLKAIDAKYASDKEKIEYDSKSKELEIQKQYADANFAIQVAQIISATALGIITTWSTAMQLGPIAGPIAAAALSVIIGSTGALQVKAANAQRQSIKAQTLQAPASSSGSGGSSSGTSQSVVAAYDTGGYTGDGGVYEPAGIVHKGEYVVPQVVMRDPESLDYVGALERIRRSKGLANHQPKRGYASGGMVSDAPTSVSAADTAAISKLEAVVQKLENAISTFPARVYVTTDDISEGLSNASKIAVRTNQ